MNPQRQLYLIGGLLFLFGLYQLYAGDLLEFSLYAGAGIAFVVNALTFEPTLLKFKKPLVIASWIFIFATAIVLLYLLQFRFS